jgi:hypothetical protein
VLGSKGEVREWVGAVTDVHDRKMVEVRLLQEDKLASLVYSTRHDLPEWISDLTAWDATQ